MSGIKCFVVFCLFLLESCISPSQSSFYPSCLPIFLFTKKQYGFLVQLRLFLVTIFFCLKCRAASAWGLILLLILVFSCQYLHGNSRKVSENLSNYSMGTVAASSIVDLVGEFVFVKFLFIYSMNLVKYFSILIIGISLFSCQKDMLTTEEENAQIDKFISENGLIVSEKNCLRLKIYKN